MFRFRWIRQLFPNSKFSSTPKTRKLARPSVKPKLESLEQRELLSADPISQTAGSTMLLAHTASNTAGANNGVSPITAGYVLNLAHTIESDAEAVWQGYFSRAVAIADALWMNLHGQGQDSTSTG
jgi:hypothetical protein